MLCGRSSNQTNNSFTDSHGPDKGLTSVKEEQLVGATMAKEHIAPCVDKKEEFFAQQGPKFIRKG